MSGLENTYLLTFDDLQDYINKLLQEYSRHEVVKIIYLMQKAFQFPAGWVPLIQDDNVERWVKVRTLHSQKIPSSWLEKGTTELEKIDQQCVLMANILIHFPWLQDSEAAGVALEFITCSSTRKVSLSKKQLRWLVEWSIDTYSVLTLVDVLKYVNEDCNRMYDGLFCGWLGVVCSYMPLLEIWNKDKLDLLTETPETQAFLDNLENIPYSNERYGSHEQEDVWTFKSL